MKEYFYADGDIHFGPYKPEELKERKIIKDTLVWCEGMNEWKRASEIDALKFLFVAIPPPIKNEILNNQNQDSNPVKSNTIRNVVIIIISLVIVVVAVVLIINFINSEKNKDDSNTNSTTINNSTDKKSEGNSKSSSTDNNKKTGSITPPEIVAQMFLIYMGKKEYAHAKKVATDESATVIDQVGSFDLGSKTKEPPKITGMTCTTNKDVAHCKYQSDGVGNKIDLLKKDEQWLVEFKKETSSTEGAGAELNYNGLYEYSNDNNMGSVTIKNYKNKKFNFSISVATQDCTGEIAGIGTVKSDSKGYYSDENCKQLTFNFSKTKITIDEESCIFYHGARCMFTGVYIKK